MTGNIIDKRPSLYSRLSSLFIVQIVFVFIVLALVLFYPQPDSGLDNDLAALRREVVDFGRQVALRGRFYNVRSGSPLPSVVADELTTLLREKKRIRSAYIFGPGPSDTPVVVYGFAQDVPDDVSTYQIVSEDQRRVVHAVVRNMLSESPGILLSSVLDDHYSAYYYSLGSLTGSPIVVVATVDHGLLVSNRSNLEHALLLMFLVSTLLSLLTIQLIRVRVKTPLLQLLRGLEKTTEGELYYQIETAGDSELNSLNEAFNRMSRTLWDNQQNLKAYNERLKQINVTLIESQSFLSALIDNSPLAVVAAAPDGRIMLFNRMASQVFGYESDKSRGMPVARLFAYNRDGRPDDVGKTSDGQGVEVRCRRADGSSFPAYLIPTPVYGRDGEVSAFVHIIKDISESAGFQEMMIRLDRYSTRGEMAGDIAHEINSDLAVLQGNLELLPIILKKGKVEKIDKKLAVMQDTVARIARFADGLMDVPQDKVTLEQADLNQLIENLMAFLKPQNRFDGVTLRTELSPDLPLVLFDSAQLQQLLMNLVINAADATRGLEGERVITIRTIPAGPDAGRVARVEVTDNGPGVPQDKQPLLFSRRFTTKRKGHGIGLITCQRIIESHNGTIGYRQDGGAVFQFEIPLGPVSSVPEKPAAVTASAVSR